jgi:hypothetical protein
VIKGLQWCSTECERPIRERQEIATVVAEADAEPTTYVIHTPALQRLRKGQERDGRMPGLGPIDANVLGNAANITGLRPTSPDSLPDLTCRWARPTP